MKESEEIIKLYLSGKTSIEIGRIFNMKYTDVIKILEKNNIKRRAAGARRRLNDEEVYNLYKSGLTAEEVGLTFNMHPSTVYRLVKRVCQEKNLTPINKRNKIDQINKKELIKLAKSGMKTKDLALHFLVSNTTILKKLKRLNVYKKGI